MSWGRMDNEVRCLKWRLSYCDNSCRCEEYSISGETCGCVSVERFASGLLSHQSVNQSTTNRLPQQQLAVYISIHNQRYYILSHVHNNIQSTEK